MTSRARIVPAILLGLSLLLGVPAHPTAANELQSVVAQRPGFPAIFDPGRIFFGSVTLADLTNDNRPEILVGSETGLLYVLNANGSLRWKFNVSAALNAAAASQPGMAASSTPISIRSAPAVADVLGDSRPEIFVSAGDVTAAQSHGGVVGLSADGQLLPGWPQLACDVGARTPPPSYTPQLTCAQLNGGDGYADGVVSSPAIGDITGDGEPEIIYGAFDQLTYARRPDGSMLPGWPQHALDTIWSSPALADLDGDKVNEVIIGVDAHRYRGPSWNAQFRETFDGGYMMAYGGDGAIRWASFQDEIFQSSPAVADLDGDGLPEIAAGTGSFYNRGRYFSVWNHDGSLLWRTALPTQISGSPAIGDITGDAGLEVVVGGSDGIVYVFDGSTGAIRWSTQPRDVLNNPGPTFTPVLGDYDGDGRDDVFIALGWDVVVLRGTDGVQFTGVNPGSAQPSYHTDYLVNGTPALGDLDADGKLDLVVASGTTASGLAQINSWSMGSSTARTSWPMFRRNPAHTALFVPRLLKPSVGRLGAVIEKDAELTVRVSIASSDGSPLNWTVSKSDAQGFVSLSRTSGSQNNDLLVTLDPDANGSYSAELTFKSSGVPDVKVPVTATIVNSTFKVYVPALFR